MTQKLQMSPVVRYLHQLERALKQRAGIAPEEALTDAREFLVRDMESLTRCESGLTDNELFEHFVATLGAPERVAGSYEDASHSSRSILSGVAPRWRICCVTCGRSAPAEQAGITRIGARSNHKYIIGWCRDCRWFRWLRLQRDLDQANLSDALGMQRTGAQLRQVMHKPWRVMYAIFLITLMISLLLPWIIERQVGTMSNAAAPPFQATNDSSPRPVANDSGNEFDASNLFRALPADWSVKRRFDTPEHQLAAFSNKLGGKLESLSNVVLFDGQTELQVNVLVCRDAQQTRAIYDRIRSSKSNPRQVCSEGNAVVEFVVRNADQARFANEARYRLPIQPKLATYEVRFDAAPIAAGDAMAWNPLFHLFLRWDQPGQRKFAVKEIATLKSKFTCSDQLRLKTTGQGSEHSQWSFSPAAIQQADQGDLTVATFGPLPERAGFPIVSVTGRVTSQTLARIPAVPNPRSVQATPRWPVNDPAIAKLANEITGDAQSQQQSVSLLLDWFNNPRSIRFAGPTGSRHGVKKVLEQRFGHCWDYSDLFITLCRARRIPTRQVMGWLYMGPGHPGAGHVWVDVLIDGAWRQIDPTSGFGCGSDYIPLVVSDEGELSYCYASPVSIQRTDASW